MALVTVDCFEWDEAKAASNIKDHGVSFEQAMVALTDLASTEKPDLLDSTRIITIGFEPISGVLVVVTTEVTDRTRIISAWKATPADRRAYHNQRKDLP